jgi:hemerythrin
MDDKDFVKWDERYSVGIRMIDDQHKELINMANTLYVGCLQGRDAARQCFTRIIHGLVDYVNYHFSAEEQFLAAIEYPDLPAHKTQHRGFVREIMQQVKDFEEGKVFVPNKFARYLRDWVLAHIAYVDKQYGAFFAATGKSEADVLGPTTLL